MATFYKYQERDLDSQVNYADIGLGISNLVTDQLATRKAKKEAYDDQVRAFNQYLDEHPVGDDVNMTEFTADYASQMQQQMLANQRAFKNGRISERDNVVFMQNVQNGTKTMFDLSTDYQAEYADKMARMKSNDPANKSQYLESFLVQDAEGYGNFKNAKPIIDPKTGLVLMSVKQKDGTYETVSAANLQTRIKAKYDYFDTDAAATSVEAGIGTEIISAIEAASRTKGGSITEIEDKELKKGFYGALDKQLSSLLVQPLNVSSILTNTLNEDYDYTFSREEADKDPKKILLITEPGGSGTPMPDFSTKYGKEQKDRALEYLRQQVIQKIDRKVEKDAISATGINADTTAAMYGRSLQEQKDKSSLISDNIMKAFGSSPTNPASAKEAMAYLGRLSPDLNLFKLTKNGELQSQLGTKYSNIPIKGKTIYDITKSMLMTIGTPLEIQTQILKDVGAKGGKDKRLTNYGTELRGFAQETENTPVSSYESGFAATYNNLLKEKK
jgi:hypothetical protein